MNTIDFINKRIKDEYCESIIKELSDQNLIEQYKKCKSVKNKIKNLKLILEKNNINEDKISNILNDYILDLIPAGTKGVTRGLMFNNKIVKEYILDIKLEKDIYEICFEKKYELIKSDEIPDWYILNKINKKIIIGMNQLNISDGGQQLNRGYKYIMNNNYDNEKVKLLCVICNHNNVNKKDTKIYKLFDTGFSNNTLCYIKNLKNIIINFLNKLKYFIKFFY
jgi:hypothetical protein